MAEFHTVHLGQVNAYLLRGREGYLLVDAGFPRKEEVFFTRLARERIEPEEVRLAVITHVHFDHVGSLRAIQAGTGCKVAVPREEAEILERGEVAIPPGTRWFSKPFLSFARRSPRIKAFLRYSALKPDVLIPEDEKKNGQGFGLPN